MTVAHRQLKRTVAALILGLASTIAIAWGGLCYVPYLPDAPNTSERQPPSWAIRKYRSVGGADGRGAFQIVDPTWTLTEFLPARKEGTSDGSFDYRKNFLDSYRNTFETTGIDELDVRLEEEEGRWGLAVALTAGWPFKAVKDVQVYSNRTAAQRPTSVKGALPDLPESNSFRYPHYVERLPLTPIWGGLLLDILIQGAAWFVLILMLEYVAKGLRWIYGQIRRGREKCPSCGYRLEGLRSDTCPECGATIPPKNVLHEPIG